MGRIRDIRDTSDLDLHLRMPDIEPAIDAAERYVGMLQVATSMLALGTHVASRAFEYREERRRAERFAALRALAALPRARPRPAMLTLAAIGAVASAVLVARIVRTRRANDPIAAQEAADAREIAALDATNASFDLDEEVARMIDEGGSEPVQESGDGARRRVRITSNGGASSE